MKLRNKKDKWKIGTLKVFRLSPDNEVDELAVEGTGATYYYDSLEKVYAEWEDIPEEPKDHWFISEFGFVYCVEAVRMDKKRVDEIRAIGNYFSTKEEAEEAVEKLKAWKRMKDQGFKFEGWNAFGEIKADLGEKRVFEKMTDLDLLFGGEENEIKK